MNQPNPYAPPPIPAIPATDDISRQLQGIQYPLTLSFKVLADQLTALFPVIQTDVVEVTDSRVILSAGRSNAVQVGLEFVGFREGRELIHPRTKQSLGRTWMRRPELLAARKLSDEEERLLTEFRQEYRGRG